MTERELQDVRKVADLGYSWDKLKGKTLLISGGTGFIGRFIIEVIKYRNARYFDGIKVLSLSRNPLKDCGGVSYLSHDVTQPVRIDGEVDYILHLASNTHPGQYATDPVGTITANVLGCYNLLGLAVEKRIKRFLLASSVEIYGEGAGREMDESFCGYIDCNTPRAGYNEAKRVSESLCQSFRVQYGLDFVTARIARCFGADRKADTKAIAQFMRNAVEGRDIVLKSDGKQRYSFCYVADAASGILKILLDGKSGEAYNVSGDDEGKTLGDYARLIAGFAERRVVFDTDGSENIGASKATYAIVDCTKLKNTGWKPLYKPSRAMERTYRILSGK